MKIIIVANPCTLLTLAGIAQAYQKTFAGYPWFEGFKCPMCEKGFPLTHTGKTCTNCSTPKKQVLLGEYWPIDNIISDFNKEMARPGAVCLVAKEGDQIIGFTWGYNVLSNKWLDINLDAPGIHRAVSGEMFYLDEVAVTPAYQKKKIGSELVTKILSEQTNKHVILRTKEEGPMFNLVIKMGGEVIQHISRDRVIMRMTANM